MVEVFCSRCGRRCTKNPKIVEGKIYGSYCVTKIISKSKIQTFTGSESW